MKDSINWLLWSKKMLYLNLKMIKKQLWKFMNLMKIKCPLFWKFIKKVFRTRINFKKSIFSLNNIKTIRLLKFWNFRSKICLKIDWKYWIQVFTIKNKFECPKNSKLTQLRMHCWITSFIWIGFFKDSKLASWWT